MAEKTEQNPMNTTGDMELHDDEMFSQSQNFLESPEEFGGSQPKRPRLINTSQDRESDCSSHEVSTVFSEFTVTQKSSNHSAYFMDFMNKTVLHHKIPYWNERETKGDGNCFYNAIIDQFQNNPGVYDTLSEDAKQCSTPSELRAAVITFIASWPQVLSEQETLTLWKESGLGEGNLDWESYLKKPKAAWHLCR